MRFACGVILVVLTPLIGSGCLSDPPPEDITVKTIFRGRGGIEEIRFSNEKVLSRVGHGIEVLDRIKVPEGPPVYLFRAATCRECEPDYEMLVYSTGQDKLVRIPFSGKVIAEDPASDFSMKIFEADSFYGKCAEMDEPVVLGYLRRWEAIRIPGADFSKSEPGWKKGSDTPSRKAFTGWRITDEGELEPVSESEAPPLKKVREKTYLGPACKEPEPVNRRAYL